MNLKKVPRSCPVLACLVGSNATAKPFEDSRACAFSRRTSTAVGPRSHARRAGGAQRCRRASLGCEAAPFVPSSLLGASGLGAELKHRGRLRIGLDGRVLLGQGRGSHHTCRSPDGSRSLGSLSIAQGQRVALASPLGPRRGQTLPISDSRQQRRLITWPQSKALRELPKVGLPGKLRRSFLTS